MATTTIDFSNQGTFTTPTFNAENLTLTGSNTLNLINFNGLAVVGGSDTLIDTGEWVNFSFNGELVTNVSLFISVVSNGDFDDNFGEYQIEAFGVDGVGLGLKTINSSFGGSTDISTLFGNQPIASFRYQPNGDSFRISSISYLRPLFIITPADGTTAVVEGGATDQVSVVLRLQPTRTVVLAIDAGDQLTTSAPLLTFTPSNWNTPQIVTVSAIDDAFFEGKHTSSLTFTSISSEADFDSAAISPLTYTITDNDARPINLSLVGTAQADVLTGGVGNDTIRGLRGSDTLSGLQGKDLLNGGLGNDRIFAGADNDTVLGSDGNDWLSGSAGNDNLTGGLGRDTLNGGRGADTLNGSGGTDVLNGGVDNDFLRGGSDADTLQGGAGADTFFFAPADSSIDTIGDFAPGEDIIQVSSTFGGGLVVGVLSADIFVVGIAAGDTSDRFIYNPTTGALSFDIDGTGAVPAVQIATLTNQPALTAANIVVT